VVKLINGKTYLVNKNTLVSKNEESDTLLSAKYGFSKRYIDSAAKNTISYPILSEHNTSNDRKNLKIKFDAMASHDITYVGIIQTARASGLQKFDIDYVLTNCHNSLCAVGGTINEDDHMFGISAAKKYGGVYVPAHIAVIHQYMRECKSGCGKMILGSDSHTRYGALGTMAVGEGGPELVKQLLGRTYDIAAPEVICIYLENAPKKGVGPQDVALAIIKAVFKNGFVKNKIMEFTGPGLASLSADFRIGIDVMTTETTCLSSIWETDDTIKKYYETMKRKDDFKKLAPKNLALYDGAVVVDLSKIESMIALPFHPSNVYTVKELNENPYDILSIAQKEADAQLENKNISTRLVDKIVDGKIRVDQGVIAGCAGGGYENLYCAAQYLKGRSIGADEFSLSVYPASQPIYIELMRRGIAEEFMKSGATMRTAFCGPCFGAGDVPSNNGLSIRHSTRNFPNREGSKPAQGQIASVALMDARSIAATAANKGILTPATEIDIDFEVPKFRFDDTVYNNRVYNGYGKARPDEELLFGPNIADWPKMNELTDDVILSVVSVITDPVTTTDELIPSGETSSYRSNPLKLAEFALSRKDPNYVSKAKAVQFAEKARLEGEHPEEKLDSLAKAYELIAKKFPKFDKNKTSIGSAVFANKPGDGSAREQAASCQKVLGGYANFAMEYATKRYRSNLINWGMLPFIVKENVFCEHDLVYVPNIKTAVMKAKDEIDAFIIRSGDMIPLKLTLSSLTKDERDIILSGCLINYYNRKV